MRKKRNKKQVMQKQSLTTSSPMSNQSLSTGYLGKAPGPVLIAEHSFVTRQGVSSWSIWVSFLGCVPSQPTCCGQVE